MLTGLNPLMKPYVLAGLMVSAEVLMTKVIKSALHRADPTVIGAKLISKRLNMLLKKNLMQPKGIEVWQKRNKKNTSKSVKELEHIQLDKTFEAKIKANARAWEYFNTKLAPASKRISVLWVMSAKQETTRFKRLGVLIESSEKNEKIPQLRWSKK